MINAQEWLNENYPQEQRSKITELNINYKLEGELDLRDFVQLKRIRCSNNQLTNLDLSNCQQLILLRCNDNYLQELRFSSVAKQLTYLDIRNNNFPEQNLSLFSHLVNLEELRIGNDNQVKIRQGIYNRFYGSLEPLKDLTKLNELNIDNTDIDSGVKYLSKSLSGKYKKISCSTQARPRSKVKEIKEQLKLFADEEEQRLWAEKGFTYEQSLAKVSSVKYGLCYECKEPNTGKEWCQSCNAQYLRIQFKNWTSGNQDIDECIQKSQLEAPDADKLLEWIPYEQFEIKKDEQGNDKVLGEGGFGKVYQAKWSNRDGGNPIAKWNENKNKVIRKILSNEKNRGKAIRKDIIEKIINDGDTSASVIIIDDSGEYNLTKSSCFDRIGSSEYKHFKERFVALKSPNNSRSMIDNFLQEVINHKKVESEMIVSCFGISQDPQTKNYLMVMDYIKDGNLRNHLQNNHSRLGLDSKIEQLLRIARGLSQIHQQGLIHQDLHSGNILSGHDGLYITDLGLCLPTNYQPKEGKTFGVLPYVAPEVLQGQPYTQATDIYSWGVIAYELLANEYPYPKMDDLELSLKVCNGLRPNLDKVPIPKLLKDLIKRCWGVDPEKRPNAWELCKIIDDWYDEYNNKTNNYIIKKNNEFYQQYKETEQEYKIFSQKTYQIYPSAIATSRMINAREISERLSRLIDSGQPGLKIIEKEEPQISATIRERNELAEQLKVKKDSLQILQHEIQQLETRIKELEEQEQYQAQIEIPPKK